MSTHGPWTYRPDGLMVYSGHPGFPGDAVCAMVEGPHCTERMALIAAAPDLLAALEAFVEAEDTNTSLYRGYGRGATLYKQARAALAKAKGEAHV